MKSVLLVSNPTNIRYLTGFVGVDKRDAYLLLLKSHMYLFTSSLYLEQAKLLKNPTTVIEINRDNPLAKQLVKVLKQHNVKKLAFEEMDLTVSEYNKLKKELKGIILAPQKNRIEHVRMTKKDWEIEHIRHAAKITDDCFQYILKKLRVGITESEIAWDIESYFRMQGAGSAFSPIVAFNTNSSQPHYQSTNNDRLIKNSLVLLDFGARVNGYCADMTRVVFVGQPKSEWKNAYETVLSAQEKALSYLASHIGTTELKGKEADHVAREAIKDAGLPVYPHSLGHAVGLDIHEMPRLSIKKPAALTPDMVITIEPGVYVEGQYGIRIEDLVLLKETSIEVLSKSTKELIIL